MDMKNIKRMISGWVTGALFLGLLSACEKEKTLMYEQEAGVYFYGQAASEYSFVTNLGEMFTCKIFGWQQRVIP